MKAIILAAGRGSRMKEMTDDRPKCLIKVHSKTLLDLQIDALHKSGINDIAIVTGYRRELLQTRGLLEFYNSRWAETNMMYSLSLADKWLSSETCIISYSDIFFDQSAPSLLIKNDFPLAVTYDENWRSLWERRFGDPLLDAESFRVNSNGILTQIGGKPAKIEEIQGQYMGLLRFTAKGWAETYKIFKSLPSKERDSIHMTGILQKVIEAGSVAISAIPYSGNWGEIDSPKDLSLYGEGNN